MSDASDPASVLDDVVSSIDASGCATFVLNRPRALNALRPSMLGRLEHLFRQASADDGVRAIRLQGSGEAFCAGFDIKELSNADAGVDFSEAVLGATSAIRSCRKPTIAVVRGHCLGAGLDLALACDVRIAVGSANFALPATKLGSVYDPRSVDSILRLLGPTTTKALFVMGQAFSSQEALQTGIVNVVTSEDDLEEVVVGWSRFSDTTVGAALAHKLIIETLLATTDRSPAFWAPLHELRTRSLSAPERSSAIQGFLRPAVQPTEQG
jgi:enoyl-CoA hydratase/carnithine racemase